MPEEQRTPSDTATDPVCGMTVEIETASAAGLTIEEDGVIYYFCGRGCNLDFGDDPARYLDPGYKPSM
jgi:YHS domain-containing protein